MARKKPPKRASKQIKSRKRRLFLPYPLIVFLLLCAGTFLLASSLNVGADDIFVTAAVHAPPVTQPAEITSPSDGTRFSAIPIPVSGTCPSGAAYVEIFRNNLMSGTALCTGGGFQLSTDLFPGQNNLVAHVFNITDDAGPVSAMVTVYYDVPQPPSAQPGQPAGQPTVNPLTLKTAFVYKGYYVGQAVVWPVEIAGGTGPYAINVDWGDGHNSVISRSSAGQFDINHTYVRPGDKQGTFTVKVQASDSDNGTAYLQFFVIVNLKQTASNAGNIFGKSPPSLNGKNWLWVAWPAYIALLILVISFWLGEREELIILRRRGQLKR